MNFDLIISTDLSSYRNYFNHYVLYVTAGDILGKDLVKSFYQLVSANKCYDIIEFEEVAKGRYDFIKNLIKDKENYINKFYKTCVLNKVDFSLDLNLQVGYYLSEKESVAILDKNLYERKSKSIYLDLFKTKEWLRYKNYSDSSLMNYLKEETKKFKNMKSLNRADRNFNSLIFETNITEHCDLNCARCSHFCPVSKPFFYPLNQYEEELIKLSDKTVYKILLLGGEPLLNPHINDFIIFTKKHFKDAELWIFTNGMHLLEQDQSFFDLCRENKVTIKISPYPVNYIIKEKLFEKLFEENIHFQYGNDSVCMRFINIALNENGQNDKNVSFYSCASNECIVLKNGRLYNCDTLALIDNFNEYFHTNFKRKESDSISIENSMEAIMKFLQTPKDFCRYCVKNKIKYDWEVSKKDISEWTQ
jgi:organic radical activating enzyme